MCDGNDVTPGRALRCPPTCHASFCVNTQAQKPSEVVSNLENLERKVGSAHGSCPRPPRLLCPLSPRSLSPPPCGHATCFSVNHVARVIAFPSTFPLRTGLLAASSRGCRLQSECLRGSAAHILVLSLGPGRLPRGHPFTWSGWGQVPSVAAVPPSTRLRGARSSGRIASVSRRPSGASVFVLVCVVSGAVTGVLAASPSEPAQRPNSRDCASGVDRRRASARSGDRRLRLPVRRGVVLLSFP